MSRPGLQVVCGGDKDLWLEDAPHGKYKLSTFSISLDQAPHSDPFTFVHQEEGIGHGQWSSKTLAPQHGTHCDQNPDRSQRKW